MKCIYFEISKLEILYLKDKECILEHIKELIPKKISKNNEEYKKEILKEKNLTKIFNEISNSFINSNKDADIHCYVKITSCSNENTIKFILDKNGKIERFIC